MSSNSQYVVEESQEFRLEITMRREMTLLLVTLVLLLSNLSAAKYTCPDIDPFSAVLTLVPGGSYVYTISVSETVNQAPANTQACANDAYISKYIIGGSCVSYADSLYSDPEVIESRCVYRFTNANTSEIYTVALTCDPSATTVALNTTVPVFMLEGGAILYQLRGNYSGVCGPAYQACGPGCVFLIIFFAGGGIYVIGTVAWNYIKGAKRGKELATQPLFWKMVPGILKDGAIAAASCVSKPFRKRPTYAQV